jgi:hypothetical protein
VEITEPARAELRELRRRYGDRIPREFQQALDMIQRGQLPPGDHGLSGQLRGWRAFAVGPQIEPDKPRVVYFTSSHLITIFAAGDHEDAYRRAGPPTPLVVVAHTETDQVIRIISMRYAERHEEAIYWKAVRG